MLTEDEAKTKWCPFSRMAFQYREGCNDAMITCNRDELGGPVGPCIASACMAWRWGDGREVGTNQKCERCGGSGVVVVDAGGEDCSGCVSGYQVDIVPTGYCGLAGKE